MLELRLSSNQLQLAVGSEVSQVSLSGLEFTGSWEYVVFSFITDNFFPDAGGSGGSDSTVTVNLYVNDIQVQTDFTLSSHPSSISSVVIGDGYSGLLQDVGIEARSMDDSNITSLLREEASFIPQCLCPSNSSLSADEESCDSSPR